jgi:hypothetical protein
VGNATSLGAALAMAGNIWKGASSHFDLGLKKL